jgi:hypothetical protein
LRSFVTYQFGVRPFFRGCAFLGKEVYIARGALRGHAQAYQRLPGHHPLPEPVTLKRFGIVKYRRGDQNFEVFCWACSVRKEVWEDTGEETTWLHLKGCQAFTGQIVDKSGVTLLVPTKYVTAIEPGPAFQQTRKRTSADVGVFPPDSPAPDGAMSLSEIRRVIADLQIPLVETTITVRRKEKMTPLELPRLPHLVARRGLPGPQQDRTRTFGCRPVEKVGLDLPLPFKESCPSCRRTTVKNHGTEEDQPMSKVEMMRVALKELGEATSEELSAFLEKA